jgi:transposase
MRNHTPIHLTNEERNQLETIIHKGNAPARVQTRARILLLTDHSQGKHQTDKQIAQTLLCAQATLVNIRKRYQKEGLQEALQEKPRPGKMPTFDGEAQARLTLLACSEPPLGQARWTLRLLADKVVELGIVSEVSHVTIGETLKKMKLNLGVSRHGA